MARRASEEAGAVAVVVAAFPGAEILGSRIMPPEPPEPELELEHAAQPLPPASDNGSKG